MNPLKNSFKKNASDILEALPDLYLILDINLNIVQASNAYLQTAFINRSKIIGRSVFEIFDVSDDLDKLFISELRHSLNQVLANKTADSMLMQKRNNSTSSALQELDLVYWLPLNTPILDKKNEILFIIHKIIDMTSFVKRQKSSRTMQAQLHEYIAEVEEANRRLRSLEATRMAMIEAIPDAMLVVNREGIIIYINHPLEALFGYAQDELLGKKIELLIPEPFRKKHATHRESYFKNPLVRPMGTGRELSGQHKNGSIFSVEISLSPLLTPEGQFALAIIRDISQHVQQTKKLETNEEELQKVNQKLEQDRNSLQKINNKIILITEFSETLIACANEHEIIEAISSYISEILNFSKGALYLFNRLDNEFELKTFWGESQNSFKLKFNTRECWGMRNGTLHEKNSFHPAVQCQHLPEFQPAISYICMPVIAHNEVYGLISLQVENVNFQASMVNVIVNMVSKTIAIAVANVNLQQLLKDQALHDTLTGLYNRRFFDDYLKRQIINAQREKQEFGIILFDIDNFKQANDTYGHEVGDTILHRLGMLLSKIIRANDVVCRYGGEEFVCVLSNSSSALTKKRGEEIRVAVSKLFEGPMPPRTTISVGVSAYPSDGATACELIEAADKAMYVAKRMGKNRLVMFQDIEDKE